MLITLNINPFSLYLQHTVYVTPKGAMLRSLMSRKMIAMLKNHSEKFSVFFFKKADSGQIILPSSACRGGGGCYQCKCAPRKKV